MVVPEKIVPGNVRYVLDDLKFKDAQRQLTELFFYKGKVFNEGCDMDNLPRVFVSGSETYCKICIKLMPYSEAKEKYECLNCGLLVDREVVDDSHKSLEVDTVIRVCDRKRLLGVMLNILNGREIEWAKQIEPNS